ncbi:MAG TPA: VOC family protein [Pararhizobium sp.]|uniref:VOC family protein n=1 Tax=Pararhizobium sp. TaxID=1977563 RepID=UPI002CB848EA|nr:VOC family protein [Pararhizobium sp.]HTO30608.1 VOC family protein [Pararhizobium sp.]
MRYLHTMVRVKNLDASLHFWSKLFGLVEIRRYENEKGRFTLVFLAASGDLDHAKAELSPCLELTYNWDTEDYTGGRNFGHLAYEVDDIYATCQHLQDSGVIINRPPRDGHMAFVRSPDGISIEILQKGENLPAQEPWASMPNTGAW